MTLPKGGFEVGCGPCAARVWSISTENKNGYFTGRDGHR